MTEEQLYNIAQNHPCDKEALKAFNELKKIDNTYHYCSDCDDLLTTSLNCCLNQQPTENDIEYINKVFNDDL
jgi:hypothetical protein